MTIGRIGEFHTENCRVILRLLKTVAGKFVGRLCFDHCQHEISGVAQKIISPFARTSASLDAHGNNAAVGETFLLADLIVAPAGAVQFRQDVLSTGVGFSDHEEC